MSGDDALARIDDDEDDEGQSVTIDPRTCVIFGLQSDAGKDLNGQMGMVEDSIEVIQTAKPEDRLPVRLMRGEKKAVRRKNLELICMKRDSSGVGVSTVVLNPFGPGSYISYSRFGHSGPTQEKMEDALSKPEVLRFERVDELPVPLQFLLFCGARPDLQRAQEALQKMIDGNCRAVMVDDDDSDDDPFPNIPSVAEAEAAQEATRDAVAEPAPAAAPAGQLVEMELPPYTLLPAALVTRCASAGLGLLRVPGSGFTALEWAAKHGNLQIVEWLCDDDRTCDLLHQGSPVGWACYAGNVDVARLLLKRGAEPTATDQVLWCGLPPFLAAAEGGQVEALELLVQEQKVSIHTTGDDGLGILHRIRQIPGYEKKPKLVAAEEWALSRGAKEQYIKWKEMPPPTGLPGMF